MVGATGGGARSGRHTAPLTPTTITRYRGRGRRLGHRPHSLPQLAKGHIHNAGLDVRTAHRAAGRGNHRHRIRTVATQRVATAVKGRGGAGGWRRPERERAAGAEEGGGVNTGRCRRGRKGHQGGGGRRRGRRCGLWRAGDAHGRNRI